MSTPYAWSCLACEQDNPAAADTCGRCGCAAAANAAAIDGAGAAWRRRTGIAAPPRFDLQAAPTDFPLLNIASVVLVALGGLMLVVSTGPSATAFGALLLALAALCFSSARPRLREAKRAAAAAG